MNNLSKQAFDGLANNYNLARPSYPKVLYSSIISYWQLKNRPHKNALIIADIGCGTGISTRAFYHALEGQCKMIGVKPGKDMLKTAIESSSKEIHFLEGNAENIPLDNESVNIVTAAQAVQWFDRLKFYNEKKEY